jgi:hypothetical protein
MLQRGEFPTVMLDSTDLQYLKSLNTNYKKVEEVRESDRQWSIYVLASQASSIVSPTTP